MLFAFCVIAFAMMFGCGAIWRRSRDAPLPYCARLEPLDFSG
jgi:hypothetical protein